MSGRVPPLHLYAFMAWKITALLFYHGNVFFFGGGGLEILTVGNIKSTFNVSACDVIQSVAEPKDIFLTPDNT